MNDRERWCLENLQAPCVDIEFLTQTHAIDWPPDERFSQDFAAWKTRFQCTTSCDDGKVHRYTFEAFLQSQNLMSKAYASVRMGMKPNSLDQLLPELPRIGLSKKYAVYNGIIDDSLSEDLVRSLKGLRFRTFGTHDSFCELLHGALEDALGSDIQSLHCATADALGEQRMYASCWDSITLQPLSVKHSMWLDLKKPLALTPDRCSKLYYAQNYDELTVILADRESPRDLQYYLDAARRLS